MSSRIWIIILSSHSRSSINFSRKGRPFLALGILTTMTGLLSSFKMPRSNVIRATILTTGAVVVALLIAARRHGEPEVAEVAEIASVASIASFEGDPWHQRALRKQSPIKKPQLDLPNLENMSQMMAGDSGAILKFGNPGESHEDRPLQLTLIISHTTLSYNWQYRPDKRFYGPQSVCHSV